MVSCSSDTNDGVERLHLRIIIVRLLKAMHCAAKIHMLFRPLNVNEHYVYHVIKLFEGTGDNCDHPEAGQPHSTRMKNVANAIPLESLETSAVSKKSSPKRTILHQELFCVLSEKT